MIWLTTILFAVFLGNSRGGEYDDYMLLSYKYELEDINAMLSYKGELEDIDTMLSDDVTNDVFFYLYTRGGPSEGEELFLDEPGSLESSFFNPNNLTKIIIHGFRDNSKNPMAQSMKDKFLEQEEVNVILVDWSKIAKGIDYFIIAKKTMDVGSCVAQLVEFLVQSGGADLDDVHLIGHSLGAHVAGFAGAGLDIGTVARITGLDPAMPGFYQVPSDQRLDRSNAKFVDCIHTCAGILGTPEAICTADFYPNGGKNTQPGCPFYDFGRCSHKRAHNYFTESIDPNHKFPALRCESVPDDAKFPSSCTPTLVTMGYYAKMDIFGIYFVTTNGRQPFAPIHP